MTIQQGIPKGGAVAVNDLLDRCAKIQPGQEVLLVMRGTQGQWKVKSVERGKIALADQDSYSFIRTISQITGMADARPSYRDAQIFPQEWAWANACLAILCDP